MRIEMKSKSKQSSAYQSRGLTRRNLLGFAGAAIASASIPSPGADLSLATRHYQISKPDSSVMNPLSAYMSEAATRALPQEVAEKTKQHILDTLAAMISGSRLLPGRRSLQFAEAYGGRPMSAVVASKLSCGAIEAALANGVLAHADETDDSHSPSQSHHSWNRTRGHARTRA